MPGTFVLDCSVAAKWVLPEPGRAPALVAFISRSPWNTVLRFLPRTSDSCGPEGADILLFGCCNNGASAATSGAVRHRHTAEARGYL